MPSTTIKYFTYAHLKPELQEIATLLTAVAIQMEEILPDGSEKSAGMRKLLEAKDCFVRARLDQLQEKK